MERQFITFKVGNFFYCVDIMDVQEVVRESSVTHMPNFPSFVEGVINLRGVVTPIISIHKRLCAESLLKKNPEKKISKDLEEFDAYFSNTNPSLVSQNIYDKFSESSLKDGQSYKLVIVKVDSVIVGLLVDQLDKILIVESDQVQNAEGLGKSFSHKMVSGIIHENNDIYIVLNAQGILASDEKELLEERLFS